jgi:hypothetical protein
MQSMVLVPTNTYLAINARICYTDHMKTHDTYDPECDFDAPSHDADLAVGFGCFVLYCVYLVFC